MIRKNYLAAEPSIDDYESWGAWYDGLTQEEKEYLDKERGITPEMRQNACERVKATIRKFREKIDN